MMATKAKAKVPRCVEGEPVYNDYIPGCERPTDAAGAGVGDVHLKTDSIEAEWGLRPGNAPKQSRDPFGRPYDTLTHAGVKQEGEAVQWWADCPEEAILRYRQELSAYIARHKGQAEVIHWRQRPTLEQQDGKWKVYSRLSLSNLDDRAVA